MTKEQGDLPPDKVRQQQKSMSFRLEAFLKKLKEEQCKKTKNPPDNPDISG